ncbi:MAG: YgiT-type zinc finger protein [candidate division KSB1 bacterium]|nr:YgiT-type zinc finger protein [candidate division KSB1 bacterium]
MAWSNSEKDTRVDTDDLRNLWQKRRAAKTCDPFYGKGYNLLVLENIPMVSCPNCGERYFTAETLHEIEKIKTQQKTIAKKRSIPGADFA